MTHKSASTSLDEINRFLRTLQTATFVGSLSVAVRQGSTSSKFRIEVDGDRPEVLWIRWYWTSDLVISTPELIATPYHDSNGTLQVDLLRNPSWPHNLELDLPANARWVLAVAWGLYPTDATLQHDSGKHEFVPTTTSSTTSTTSSSTTGSTSTSSTSSSTTTGSTSTSSSSTESTSTSSSSSSTTGQRIMAEWVWTKSRDGGKWVLAEPCPEGMHAKPPKIDGKKFGDTAFTPCQ